jgi:hypothetical protein
MPVLFYSHEMKVVICTLCQEASNSGGVLNIRNAFGDLVVPRMPFRATIAIATRLFFTATEQGRFFGIARLLDPDGAELARDDIKIDVIVSVPAASGVLADSVGQFSATIRKAGEHQFRLEPHHGEPFVLPVYVSAKVQN